MSEQIGGDVVDTNTEQTPAPAVASTKPQEGDVDSAGDKGSHQGAGGSTLGEEGWVAVETTIPDPTLVDPTRPSDEQILTYENELR